MYDYIIVGGGISGLYNYKKLLEINKNYKIKLLEKNEYFGGRIHQHEEYFLDHNYSFPCGAARFNINHKLVIKLMKEFGLLDMRSSKGQIPKIEFIDSKKQFSNHYKNKNGFEIIDKILKHASSTDSYVLKHYSFQEYAEKYISNVDFEFIINSCGYSGQLKNMNMYDAYRLFSEGIRDDVKFFLGKFQLLINAMLKYLKENKANMSLRCEVNNIYFNKKKDAYRLIYNKSNVLYTQKVVFCLPKEGLLKINALKPIHCILNESITTKPLCRIYAIFDKSSTWLKTIKNKITTNNQLRFIIPIDPDNGLIMISYTDDIHTEYWYKKKNSQRIMKKTIVKLIYETFKINVNEPQKVITCFWKSGVAYWNKNINSDKISEFLINPFSNIYICGENYSQNQSWVEGALETCNNFLTTQSI